MYTSLGRTWEWGYICTMADMFRSLLHSYILSILVSIPSWTVHGSTALLTEAVKNVSYTCTFFFECNKKKLEISIIWYSDTGLGMMVHTSPGLRHRMADVATEESSSAYPTNQKRIDPSDPPLAKRDSWTGCHARAKGRNTCSHYAQAHIHTHHQSVIT